MRFDVAKTMHPVDQLLETAIADSHLLYSNREAGDEYWKPRDLDFVFYSSEKKQIKTVASFVTDNRYGDPRIEKFKDDDGKTKFRLIVTVNAPTTDPIVHSISALMCMLAGLFGIEYDGWGCVMQRPATPPPSASPPPLPST